MADLRSKPLIVAKGVMFFIVVLASGGLLLQRSPEWTTLLLVLLLAWSAARFYYFLFYVLERYVDPRLRYAGLLTLLAQLRRTRGPRP